MSKKLLWKSSSIFAVISSIVFGAVFGGCTKKEPAPEGTSIQVQTNVAPVTSLKIEDAQVGTGAEAVTGKVVSVHYTGWLTNGTEFDSSRKRGVPFEFKLGDRKVIAGWDQGVVGMKVGGKRKLTIPPQLAYGEKGIGGVIPPNATLVFEVELMGVQ